jgi:hypothetical protein
MISILKCLSGRFVIMRNSTTPQSVTVITRQRIKDQNMVTISDAMQNTPGVSIVAEEGAPQSDGFYVRGFAVDNVTFDGLPISLESFGTSFLLADMALYDRVEVVRGGADPRHRVARGFHQLGAQAPDPRFPFQSFRQRGQLGPLRR